MPDAAATLLLAVVQGLTEFLPVSSSGHLVLFEEALELGDAGLLLPVALHLGTLAAVLMVYRHAVLGIIADLLRAVKHEMYPGPAVAIVVGIHLSVVNQFLQLPHIRTVT